MGQIEFLDRYGPAGPPSWLRACFDQCEATGYVPIYHPDGDPRPKEGCIIAETKEDPKYLKAWRKAEAEEPSDDGWHFVNCPNCHGTGIIPWWKTILRIPLWFGKGLHFFWVAPNHPDWSSFKNKWTAFKIAFLYDLGLRRFFERRQS